MQVLSLIIRGTIFFFWYLLMAPIQAILLRFTHGPLTYYIPSFWQRRICRAFGVHVLTEGRAIRKGQVLYVGNHISYLDILALGSVLHGSFVAKNEVAGWPVFGTLARLQQTVFISRERNNARAGNTALSDALNEGKNLILFPEGTSTDGRDVAPFKSSLFSAALDQAHRDLLIQPVTLRVDQVDGRSPDDQAVRDLYAWYGDMTMPPHLKAFTASKGATVTVIFHAPVNPKDWSDRKALADFCWTTVQSGLTKQNLAPGLAA